MARKKQKSDNTNRLIGWLVSYESDELGTAHEIRAGRTLISANGGSGPRIVTIAQDDISEPHLAINADASHEVLIQDIFSEAGSFLTKTDSKEETAVEGPISVSHGDWLRVGSTTRFQVCLIDGPQRS
jgi:hypothetical protein